MDKCNEEIYNHGVTVMVAHPASDEAIERWVKEAATESGLRIDWLWFGGRANILTLDDPSEAYKALRKHRQIHDESFLDEYSTCLPLEAAERSLASIWNEG